MPQLKAKNVAPSPEAIASPEAVASPEAIASRAFRWLLFPFVLSSLLFPTSLLSFQLLLRSLLPPHCFILFIHLFLSFKVKGVHFVGFVFSLKSSVLFFLLFLSCQLVHFIASVFFLQLFPSIRCFLPFASTLCNPVRYFFRFNSSLLFPIRGSFRFKSF